MCGLAGIFHPSGAAVDRSLLTRMTGVLSHRGPDGDGFHVEPGLGLGHRRLSIIDVAGGTQPMWNEDHSVVIIFNGEIYNFPELWPKLKALGHVFRSDHSDTEAIVHAWESWGPDCLQHLNGQFAFALWDRGQKTLFLARDRLGKKPLYYARQADGTLVFGSEMRSILEVPGISRRISPASVDDFFAYGYVPDPHTIYAGVQKLPAGHYLMLREGCHEAPRRYWSAPTQTRAIEEGEALLELGEHLAEATRLRLVSDVPLGAFLGLAGAVGVGLLLPVGRGGQQRGGGDGGGAHERRAGDVHHRLPGGGGRDAAGPADGRALRHAAACGPGAGRGLPGGGARPGARVRGAVRGQLVGADGDGLRAGAAPCDGGGVR